MTLLLDAIKELWSERKLDAKTYPLITYIVVGKRCVLDL